ncbi:hypothetical protein MCAP1_000856 [Malassezia caprae]|uniref:Uncharacterized protein n=1 Tax=Malassezia caprae TaxID=1381934 RepID=A0AAF0E4A8_9BASI|nr:hypothetical protein MCAP1_000856 [Malassezia caprae]
MRVRQRPWLAVQPSVAEVLRDVHARNVDAEDVWVSAHVAPHSVHGTLRCKRSGESAILTASPSSAAWRAEATASPDVWDVCVAGDVELSTQVHVPRVQRTWVGAQAPTVLDLQVSASGTERWAIGGADGQLYAGEWHGGGSAPAVPSVECAGHVGDVTSVRFFPSGEVLLSTSLDMRARIFSAIDGSCPRTLEGHTRAIVGSAILGLGRRIATGSADHSVRVWDVGRGAAVQQWTRDEPVTALAAYGAAQATPEAPVGALLAGGARGVHAWDVRAAPQEAWACVLPAPGGVSALCAHETRVLVGSDRGLVALFDARAPAVPLEAWVRSEARITDVWADAHGVLVATSDGLPYAASGGVQELVGWDAAPTSAVRRDAHGHVLVAGPGAWAWYA